MTGLLTTVDKLSPPLHASEQIHGASTHRNGAYFNRVPAEAKDVILQKIRQHIMDKRGNDTVSVDVNMRADSPVEPKYLYKEEVCKNDLVYQYSPANVQSSDTLDLRKFRSPSKAAEGASPKKPVANQTSNQLDTTPLPESKVEPSLPEHCELAMDYSNLPPKKKRKLIEYQEYKKQEEAKRQLEAFYAEQKERGGPPADEDKWRPW